MQVDFLAMSDGTSFGAWLTDRMDEVGLPRPSDLAKASGADQSLIGRWMRDESLPGPTNLRKIAPVLRVREAEIFARAGHLAPSTTAEPSPGRPRRAAVLDELEQLLGPSSPLPKDKRDDLESLVTALVTPYRSYKRRKRVG